MADMPMPQGQPQPMQPKPQGMPMQKKVKSNYLIPLVVALFAIVAFLGVMYFAITK